MSVPTEAAAPSGVTQRTNAELLGNAVHRNSSWSREGMRERLFTMAFGRMVYAQIWEDPVVDMAALEIKPDSRIVTISSGGCNVMSYLTANPARIVAVDLNTTHLALLKLKLAAVRYVPNYKTFYRLFGSACDQANTAVYDDLLKPHLDEATRAYWEGRDELGRRRITRFERGLYRYGLLGRFIGAAHKLARAFGGDPRKMLAARSMDEQKQIFDRELAPLFEKPLIKRLLDSPVSLYGLGIPPAQYAELRGQEQASVVVRERLRHLACDYDLKTNYFAWQAFNRGYAEDGKGPVPPYLEEANFASLKAGVANVEAKHISMTEFLRTQADGSLDRYVLLDAQDWMSAQEMTELWTEITRTARPGARVIFRSAAVPSPLTERLPAALLEKWTYAADKSKAYYEQDRSAIYGGFHLYVLNDKAA